MRVIWTPKTPFQRRMIELSRLFPPPRPHRLHDLVTARAQFEVESDLAFQMWVKDLKEKYPSFVLSRVKGGTGFPISDVLRQFFQEYAERIVSTGPHSFPMSFNVAESFLTFSHTYLAFDLREEVDHLVQLDDYIDWYTGGRFPEEPAALVDILPQGITYSYSMADPLRSFRIPTFESHLAVFGVALIRRSTELSMIAVFGESPPYPHDEELQDIKIQYSPHLKETIRPNPKLTVSDRYLKEAHGLVRVIALVRFDLSAKRYNVRYVHIDVGAGFMVATDDPDPLMHDYSPTERELFIEDMSSRVARYDSVFAALASLLFLPAFFIAEGNKVRVTTFGTALHAERSLASVRKAVRRLGRSELAFSREVRCFEGGALRPAIDSIAVTPPEFEMATDGFWKTLPPTEVGEDESGQPIVGRTWVERTDSWSAHKLEMFTARRLSHVASGPNPGWIYVMRSGSHALDLYKVGRTRRETEQRAAELTGATGVPTQFDVLARWKVGDIEKVEAEAHRRLRRYKVNKRREFFKAPLPLIVKVIEVIVDESA